MKESVRLTILVDAPIVKMLDVFVKTFHEGSRTKALIRILWDLHDVEFEGIQKALRKFKADPYYSSEEYQQLKNNQENATRSTNCEDDYEDEMDEEASRLEKIIFKD